MKRFASVVLTLAVLFGTVSGHAAGPSERWQAVKEQCGEADLRVTWYPEYEGLMRRYGTDRMLLVEEGKSYLCHLNSNVSWPDLSTLSESSQGRAMPPSQKRT